MGPGNGDKIALDLQANPHCPPVIYLDHEEPCKQLRLGNSFSEFIDTWFTLGCVDPDKEEIKSFLTEDGVLLPAECQESTTSTLDISCDNAIIFREYFGFQ